MSDPVEVPRQTSAKRAGAVTIFGQLIKIVVQLVGLIAFSRLLTPRDIGLVAMLMVFLMLGELIRDFGLSQAAIQTAKLSHGQASNLFWSSTLIGVLMTTCMFIGAPAVAAIYNEPALRGLALWVALSFTINALQTQFQVRLARDFRFVALTVTDAISQVVGLVAGLVAAFSGAGYWSLVVQMLAIYGSLLIQRAIVTGWWPGLPRREPGMRALYLFGLHSGLAQLLNYAAYNADTYIIGIRWGASALGIYNRAFQMFTVPSNQLLAPLTNVALPLLSRRRHEGTDFYSLLWKAQVAVSVAMTYVFALAASLAEPIVRVALGEQWIASAILLSILSIGGAIQVLSYIAFWAFLASGNARQLFFSGLVTRPLLIVCIVIGTVGGLEGVAWGFTAGLAAAWIICLIWLKRCDEMPIWQFFTAGFQVFLCGLVAGGSCWLLVDNVKSSYTSVALLGMGFVLVTIIYVPLVMAKSEVRKVIFELARPIAARVKTISLQKKV